MRKLKLYINLFLVILIFNTCKKKTNITVLVYNFSLGEPVANATIVLVERKGQGGGGIFAGNASCVEIATAVTNSSGECRFDKTKLKTSDKYDYFLAATNIYNTVQNYPCGGKTSGFLIKGKSQKAVLNYSYFEGAIKIINNNLLNPSQPGDSLNLLIKSAFYYVTGDSNPHGGGGVVNSYSYHGDNGYPYTSPLHSNEIKTPCGKKIIKTRKRKLGIVTTSIDTVKVYPNQITTVVIDW